MVLNCFLCWPATLCEEELTFRKAAASSTGRLSSQNVLFKVISESYNLSVGSYSVDNEKILRNMVDHTVSPGKLLHGRDMEPAGISRKCSLIN